MRLPETAFTAKGRLLAFKKILITGDNGFVGGYLKNILSANNECYSLADPEGRIDLTEASRISAFFAAAPVFDAVVHLAAHGSVAESFLNPRRTYEVNFGGTYNIIDSLVKSGFRGRFLYVSSGDVYGLVDEDSLPVREACRLLPRSPYAVSKVASEALCFQRHAVEGLDVVIARPFNHIGAGQDERYSVAGFAKQIAEIKAGLRPPLITAGDMGVTRDFLDVRDVAAAYAGLLDLSGGSGYEVHNICSGTETPLAFVISEMLDIAGVSATIETDPSRLRPGEQKRMRGSNEKIKNAVGWKAEIPLRQSLSDIIVFWEKKIAPGRNVA